MSVAIHMFTREKFSEKSYRNFLRELQSLFGKWELVEDVAFDYDLRYSTIHACWINSSDEMLPENSFRVYVKAERMSPDIPWDFEFDWAVHLETSAGRSMLGFAVQFGALLLAMDHFNFLCVVDHDTSLKSEPAEFKTNQAVREHIKRVFEWFPREYLIDLKRRGIIDENGYLTLPKQLISL